MKAGTPDDFTAAFKNDKSDKPLVQSWITLHLRNTPRQWPRIFNQILMRVCEVPSSNRCNITLFFKEFDDPLCGNMVKFQPFRNDDWLVHTPSIACALENEVCLSFLDCLGAIFNTHLSIEILQVRLHSID